MDQHEVVVLFSDSRCTLFCYALQRVTVIQGYPRSLLSVQKIEILRKAAPRRQARYEVTLSDS